MAEGNFVPDVILPLVLLVSASKHPGLEFFVRAADRLSIDVAVPLVVIGFVCPVDPIDVIGGIEAAVGYKDGTGAGKIFFQPLYDGAQVYLFRLIPGKEVIGDGDAIAVHQEAHFDNRVGPVVLFRSSFAVRRGDRLSVFINRPAVVIKGIGIRMTDIKVIIGAVEIRNRHIPLA